MFYRLSIVNADDQCKDGYGLLKVFESNGKYRLCCQTTKEIVFHFTLEGFPAYRNFLTQRSNEKVTEEEISKISGKSFENLTENQVTFYANKVIDNRIDKALDLLSVQVEGIFKIQRKPSNLKYFADINKPYKEVELSVANTNPIVARFDLSGCREYVKERDYSYSYFLMEIKKPGTECSVNYKHLRGEFDFLGGFTHICCEEKQKRRFK
jgi:hypothetical protein